MADLERIDWGGLTDTVGAVPEPLFRVYVSGPMSGVAGANETAFRLGAEWVAHVLGGEAVVPHDLLVAPHKGPCPTGRPMASGSHNEACALTADYLALIGCGGILMLPGWRSSWGAKHELALAADLGKRIWVWTEQGPLEAL